MEHTLDVKNGKPARNGALDVIRILATAAVVMIHASAPYVDGKDLPNSVFFWGDLFDSISRVGVPLFLMVSGALMLEEEKQITPRDLLSRRIPGLLVALFFWSAVYAGFYDLLLPFLKGEGIHLRPLLRTVVMGYYHLWFLYMLVGIYLALPLLREFVKKKNKDLVLYYIALSLLANFLTPVVNLLAARVERLANVNTFLEQFQLFFFNKYIAYYLAGWYIAKIGIPRKWRRPLYAGAALSVFLVGLSCYLTRDFLNAYSEGSVFVFLYSVGVFTLLFYNAGTIPEKARGPLTALSRKSFGVYLVHVLVLKNLKALGERTGLCQIWTPVYILGLFALTLVLSYLAVFGLSRVPLIRKTIRC